MDKNFKVRVICGFGLFIIALIGLYTYEGIPFKIIYGLFAIIAGIELLSFFKKKTSPLTIVLAIFEITFLVMSSIFNKKKVWQQQIDIFRL